MKSTYKYFLIVPLLDAFLGVFLFTKHSLDAYLQILLPVMMLSFAILLYTDRLRANIAFTMISIVLINLGIAMQVLINPSGTKSMVIVECIAFVLGLLCTVFMLYIQAKLSNKKQRIIFISMIILLYAILIIFGATLNGTKAWLKFGNHTFQLTEIAKGVAILGFASIFSDSELDDKRKFAYGFGFLVLNGICLAFVRELGTFAILLLVFMAMILLYEEKVSYFLVSLFGIIITIGGGTVTAFFCNVLAKKDMKFILIRYGNFIWHKIYNRVTLFTDLDKLDPYGKAYQCINARKAISLGGLLGSDYHIDIPVEESEYIFVSILLHLGYLMAIVVIILFLCMFISGLDLSMKNKNYLEQCTVIGFMVMMISQTLLAMFGTTNAFLLIGVPIPFLSAGGASYTLNFAIILYTIYVSGTEKMSRIEKKVEKGERVCRIES